MIEVGALVAIALDVTRHRVSTPKQNVFLSLRKSNCELLFSHAVADIFSLELVLLRYALRASVRVEEELAVLETDQTFPAPRLVAGVKFFGNVAWELGIWTVQRGTLGAIANYPLHPAAAEFPEPGSR